MIDSAPIEKWSDKVSVFWTFGGSGSVGTWVLTILGIAVMVAAWAAWVWLENRKLTHQAEALRAAGGIPVPSGPAASVAPSQPPLVGPSAEPGE